MAIGFSEMEFLNEIILNMRMFRYASRPIRYISKSFFLQVILVHGIEQAIIGVCCIFPFVIRQNRNQTIFTRFFPKHYREKTNKTIIFSVKYPPIIIVLVFTFR